MDHNNQAIKTSKTLQQPIDQLFTALDNEESLSFRTYHSSKTEVKKKSLERELYLILKQSAQFPENVKVFYQD